MAQDLIDKIRAAAQAKNVDPDVAVKIAQAESSLNPEAGAKTSSAKGLFQIVNKTWSGAGGKPGQQKNPDENIRVGTDLIASNTDFLRKNLGRDPRASEVYAAHFFGPTGASTLLAAAPDTPAAQLFSEKVLKANPQLQGKTADQIRGMLQQKMGETTTAPAPAKPTGPTPAEQMMEPALRSGMTASAEDLGSGYKAALALSFLGAEDADKPETDEDLQARLDREEEDAAAAEFAAYKPKNALADLKLSATSHLQQPVKLASGGLPFTPSAGIKGSSREELDAIKAQYDKYNADADAYNAALNKYKTDLYDPYIAAIAKYNAAAEEWNKGPRTTAFGMTEPTAPKEFTLTAPTAPTVSQADYDTKQAAAKQDMTQRQLAIDAASDPERYGLTINKFFADGGPVHRAGGSPMTGEDPQQEAIDEMLSEQPRSFLSRASEAVQSAARQGLDAMFPIRRIVRTGVEPTAKEAMQKFEQAVKDDPQAYLANKNFGEDLASRAHFHIKNAGRRAMGLEPFKDESRAYLGPITEDSFPNPNNPIPPELRTSTGLPPFRRGRFADGGDVVSSSMPLNPNPMAGTPELMLADGGDVETPMLFSVPTYAETVSHEMYPGQGGQFDQKDAARHMLAAGTLARKYGPEWAERLGQLHEIKTSPLAWIGSKLGISQMPVDYEQDLHNNRVGIELAKRSKSQKDLEDLINLEAERAKNQQTPGAAWIGKPVRRADGSPEEGEMGPYIGNPNIQRQGQKARELAAQRDVNTLPDPRTYAAVSGFLGTPPDQQGFSVLHPDLEGIKKAGDVGFMAGTAAQIAPAVGAMRNLGKGVTDSAKALQGLKDIPVGASTKPVEPFFRHMPTPDAPFVGRLDEFVAGMQNPVRKDQFLGQLNGKFRDYEIERAQRALADLPENAKLQPVDLLNRLKERYDPSTMRTTILEPETDRYWANQDNPYKGQPVGVVHLSTHASPEQMARINKLDKLDLTLWRLGRVEENSQAAIPGTEVFRSDPIASTQLDRIIAARQALLDQMRPLSEAKGIMNDIRYPSLSPRYDQLYRQFADEAQQANQYPGFPEIDKRVRDILIPQAEARLTQLFGEVPLSERALKEAMTKKFGENWMTEISKAEKNVEDMSRDFRRYVSGNPQIFGIEVPYKGKGIHSALNPPPNAASFTRFVEQQVQDPVHGQMKGIHLLEIQSDLTSELKAGRDVALKKHEVFPNMAENRRVVQQLGMKNAIAAAIQRGDQFVTFPGKESAKPQLYESVRDNLKQVAKDLGPGFEVRPFTFKNAEGTEMQHWGITWSPKAAVRTEIKGVPFKDGGSVERKTDDNRRYL